MILDEEFWRDRFHLCSLYAARIAQSHDRLADSEYVRGLAYQMYEGGAFREKGPHVGREKGPEPNAASQ